ncbi:HAMP domain-containing sensor histidine kinase [Angustibacter speluncae]
MSEEATRRRRWTVRAKVLASVLLVTAAGTTVTGATVYVLQLQRLDRDIRGALVQEVEEFQTLAEQGVDPETGRPFDSVEQLLRVALARNVPSANETSLTLVGGEVYALPGGDRPLRLEDEPAAMAAITAVAPDSPSRFRDVQTSAGLVRLVIVQVGVAGTPTTGTYVVAYVVDQPRTELNELMRLYALVAAGTLLLVALVGWVVAGRLLGPLRALREAAGRIDEHDLTERIPERGDDDVTELTRSYNAMLDRLQTAFESQRQFLDDAGHELRTPVTILSGHLQVLDANDPASVEETRALLLDETDRMARLVEDLILLAKSRRPDFVRPGAVDLAGLTDEVLDKARALGDRAWHLDALADARVRGDEQRLTQAVLQLCHNAVKFSEPGSTVGIGSQVVTAADGTREAHVWVRDSGVGIAAEDADRVFERFARAETGRGVEGSGLGLAIVAAIADAHGGRVDVDSDPGRGSTFTLVLPVDAPGDGTTEPEEDVP